MKKGKIFYRFCIYCMNRIKIFHELLEPTDSYFTKMITFYYEASNENFILPNTGNITKHRKLNNILLNNTQLYIYKKQ